MFLCYIMQNIGSNVCGAWAQQGLVKSRSFHSIQDKSMVEVFRLFTEVKVPTP